MLSRKFEIDETDGVLTIQSVKSGLIGRRTDFLKMAVTLVIGALCTYWLIKRVSGNAAHDEMNPAVFAILLYGLIDLYQKHFGALRWVFDAKNGEIRFGEGKPMKPAEIVRVRVAIPVFNLLPRWLGSRMLVLETVSGADRAILYTFVSGEAGDAKLGEIVSRVNEFVAKQTALERNERNMIWSWEQGKNISA